MGLTGHIYDAVPKCRGKDSMEEWLGPGGEQGQISWKDIPGEERGKKVRSRHFGEGKAGLRRGEWPTPGPGRKGSLGCEVLYLHGGLSWCYLFQGRRGGAVYLYKVSTLCPLPQLLQLPLALLTLHLLFFSLQQEDSQTPPPRGTSLYSPGRPCSWHLGASRFQESGPESSISAT